MKRLIRWLLLWDGIWSLPLGLMAFFLSGSLIQYTFSDPLSQNAPGFYDPSFIQAGFYASAMMVLINLTVWLGLYFNFRYVWRYFVGQMQKDDTVNNESKIDFEKLPSWLKLSLVVFLYAFFSAEWLVLFSLLL